MSIFHTAISLIPFAVCALWAVYFGAHYKQAHVSKKVMFWFMLTAASLYYGHFVVFNKMYSQIPLTDTVYTFATLSVYPIYFLYIVSLTGKLNWKYYMVLLPGIIIALVIGVCYILIPEHLQQEFLAYCHYNMGEPVDDVVCEVSMFAHVLMKYVILIGVILSLAFGLKRLKDFSIKVNELFSNTEHRDMKEIRYLLTAFVITSCLSVFADLMGRAYFVDTTLSMILILIPFSVMLFLVGYTGSIQNFTIDDLICESQRPMSEENNAVKMESQRIMKENIDALMKEDKLFLQPDLKVSDLATRLNTNRTYIYDALKSGSDEEALSFPNYVNRFRIEYSIKLMNEKGATCIKSILLEVGFVSEATFYRAFKKEMGTTPREYLKQLNKKD